MEEDEIMQEIAEELDSKSTKWEKLAFLEMRILNEKDENVIKIFQKIKKEIAGTTGQFAPARRAEIAQDSFAPPAPRRKIEDTNIEQESEAASTYYPSPTLMGTPQKELIVYTPRDEELSRNEPSQSLVHIEEHSMSWRDFQSSGLEQRLISGNSIIDSRLDSGRGAGKSQVEKIEEYKRKEEHDGH